MCGAGNSYNEKLLYYYLQFLFEKKDYFIDKR